MTSKPIRGYRLDKAGKPVKKPPRLAAGQRRNKEAKARREAEAWARKSK